MTEAVLSEMVGHTLLVRINRPEAMNAIDRDVSEQLGAAVERADGDSSVRAVVLTGAGERAFSAGADLKAIGAGERIAPEREEWGFAGFVSHHISKPTIAAVNGLALGGGMEIVLASDLVVAGEHAAFGLPEVRQGLIAGAGGPFRVVEQLPWKVGLELLLTGSRLSASEALRWGLVNRVVPQGTELEAALELAAVIGDNAPLAVQATKRLAYGLRDGHLESERAAWAQTNDEMVTVFATEDAKEGPRAFAEKRQPVWQAR